MKTSERFTNAVTKLYNAFHKGELNASRCETCAVGNICDNNGDWSYMVINHQKGIYDFYRAEEIKCIKKTGYSPEELSKVEQLFLKGTGWLTGIDHNSKEQQFKGLCAVVEYLCELEGIPNVMDYTCLFETENNEPKYKLENVL